MRQDTWGPPYRAFCRTGPAHPAEEVPRSIGGRTEASAPTEGLQGVRWLGRRGRRPLRRGCIQEMRRKGGGMSKKKWILLISLAALLLAAVYVLYRFNYLPHPKYSNEKFGIETYRSQVDRDGDGVDDQTDILQSVRAYLDTPRMNKPRELSTSDPADED